jgi:protein-arginine deiminase
MHRRALVSLGLAAPFIRWASFLPALPAEIRVFADVDHSGALVGPIDTGSLRATQFAITIPLPTYLADRDVLPATDPDGAEIAPRLGRVRIETTEPLMDVALSVDGIGGDAVRLFYRTADGWRRVAASAAGGWSVAADSRGNMEIAVAVLLPEAAEGAPTPAWPRRLTVEVRAASVRAQRIPLQVAPFIIPNALETADEVLIVSRASTSDAVKGLQEWGSRVGIKVFQLEAQDPCDQWMQDAIEPGVFTCPVRGGVSHARGTLSGQRREFGAGAAGLDRQIVERLRDRGHVAVVQSVPRKATRWIDWFGNLEVSPAHTDRAGRRFPFGRIIAGQQRELSMHPDALRFLEAQGMQWPPIVLDTSWLSIGHVDEVINFVPARGGPGYKVLLPSPQVARELLDGLIARRLGELPVFAGTRDETTVAALRAGAAASDENTAVDQSIAAIRAQLRMELQLGDGDFAMIPCLFARGRAVIPNAVNCLAVNGHLVATQPKGPREGEKDLFEEAIRRALIGCDVDITFIDAWRAYHQGAGEVHCGTNAFRRLKDGAWWR